MADNDLQGYLGALPTDTKSKADAWEAYNNSTDQADFQKRIGSLNIPQSAKADLWESKFNGKGLKVTQQASAQAPSTPASVPPAAPEPKESMLGGLWDWANKPLNLGHLRESIAQGEKDTAVGPTQADVDNLNAREKGGVGAIVPWLQHQGTEAKRAVEGFGTDAAKMLLTPVGLGTAALGAAGEIGGAVGTAAKVLGGAAAAGFGTQGAVDAWTNPLPKTNEKTEDYVKRVGGDAAMLLGGVAGAVKEGQGVVSDLKSPTPATPNPVQAITPPPDVAATEAVARKAAAVGPKAASATARTVYVDPAFADEMEAWGKGVTPGPKRVILRKTDFGKTDTIQLAHTDPENPGYQYKETTAPNTFSNDPAPGLIPIDLDKTLGNRGTSAPNQFLKVAIRRKGAIAEPEMATAAPPELSVTPSPVAEPAIAPEASQPVVPESPTPQVAETTPVTEEPKQAEIAPAETPIPKAAESTGGVRPGEESASNQPPTQLTPKLRKGPGPKGGTKTVVSEEHLKSAEQAAVERFVSENNMSWAQAREAASGIVDKIKATHDVVPASEMPDGQSIIPGTKATAEVIPFNKGGGIEAPKLNLDLGGEPIASPEAPRQFDAKVSPEEAKPQAPTPPSKELGKIEDRVRPLVGRLLQADRLRRGDQSFHAIDIGIRESAKSGGEIPDDIREHLSKLLKEPVGQTLTPDQALKLEKGRGAKISAEPKIKVPNQAATEHELAGEDGERLKAQLERSQDNAMASLNDPEVPTKTKEKLTDLLTRGKHFIYEPSIEYPEATDTHESHVEAPFIKKQFGNKVPELNIKNLRTALGTQVSDFELEKHADPVDLAQLENLKRGNPVENNAGVAQEFHLGGMGESRDVREANDEYRDFRREVQRKTISKRMMGMVQELKTLKGEWKQAGGNPDSPLAKQITALADTLSPREQRLIRESFNHEDLGSTQAPSKGSTASDEQPVQASSPAKKSPSPFVAGKETPVEGIRYTKIESAIAKEYPAATAGFETLQKKAAETGGQSAYFEAMKTYAAELKSDNPYALKKAMDTLTRPGEKGAVGLNVDTYNPEELHTINAAAVHNMLTRWEGMSESELAKKKEGLRKERLTNGLEQSKPTSDDPVIRQQQAETYNELKERYDSLRRAAGASDNLASRLGETFGDWAANRAMKSDAKGMLREARGTQMRNNAIMRTAFHSIDSLMESLPTPEQDRFFDNMSKGDPQLTEFPADADTRAKWEADHGPMPDPNQVAADIRAVFDSARDRVTEHSGKLQDFFTNYMPGMYDNVARAKSFAQGWAARRPLEGDTGFLRQKMYQFHQEALKAGLQPVTSNPVRAMFMRVEQLNRYSMAHEFKNNLVGAGLADWYDQAETPPEGHVKLDDKLFQNAYGSGGYWAPEGVANTFNKFVSSGLTGQWRVPYTNFSLYDALQNTNNVANMMQLGFSVFHGVETMLNSSFGATAIGLRQALNEGKIGKGAISVAKGLSLIAPLVEDGVHGVKGIGNYLDPNKNLDYASLGNDLERANANVNAEFGKPIKEQLSNLQQVQRLKKNWADATDNLLPYDRRTFSAVKAAGNLLASGTEIVSWPLMSKLIPAVKVGAFYRMAQQIHEEYIGQPQEVINEQLRKAWDSVDNRFGQVNYDNLFMSKTTQDLARLAVRSPGWNIGTLREVGGGTIDAVKSGKDFASGKGIKISNRTAYTGAMILGTMWVNAMYQYLHTGKSPEGVDWFFPKDGSKTTQGEENRVYPKTYAYDFINFYHDPLATVAHKAAPDISTITDLIKNQDYYHYEIRDPGSSPVKQAASTLGYLAHQFVPFSVGNFQEGKLRNQKNSIEGAGGILPAPRWVGRTAAENLAYSYFEKKQSDDAGDEWEMEHKRSFVQLRNDVQSGKITDDQVEKAMNEGKILPKTVKYLYATTGKSQLQNWSERMTSPVKLWNIWDAATPAEKKILLPTMYKRMGALTTGQEQQDAMDKLEDFETKHPD